MSHTHHTCEYKQYCYVGNTAKQCRLGLFQDSDFAGDLEDSKSTSGGTLCILGSHTLNPISWMCKNQTSVSHGSTESEIISALGFWDLIVAVLGNTTQSHKEQGDLLMNKREVRSTPHLKANQKSLNQQNRKMTLKPGETSSLFKVRSFIVITMNPEFNSACRKKKQSLFH